MPFIHQNYNTSFIEHLSSNPNPVTPDPKYEVRLAPANVAEGELYWRVIGIHHLEPLENFSNRNIYMDVLDEQGKRLRNPIVWASWTWEGKQSHERADPTPLDKPENETAGNISVGSNQKVSVWIKGTSRDGNDKSDRVENLHTLHPDEVLPDGRKLNTLGHHSFYIVFQRTRKTAGGPIPLPPVEAPAELPVPTPTPTPPVGEPPVVHPEPVEGLPAPGPIFTEEERRILRQALEILIRKLDG